jgi:hypothetical protein
MGTVAEVSGFPIYTDTHRDDCNDHIFSFIRLYITVLAIFLAVVL